MNKQTVLLTVIVVVAVLRLAQDLFVPLALAVLLTFLLAPIVTRLQHWRINRLIAVIVSIALALALIGGVGDVIFGQFSDLAHQLPQYELHLRQHIAHLRGFLRGGITDSLNAIERLTGQIERLSPVIGQTYGVQKVELVQPPATVFEILKELIGPLVKPLGWALAVMVLVAFMLLRLPDLRERIIRLLGPRNLQATTAALDDAAARVSRYLLSQLLINAFTGLWVGVALALANVPNPGLWGALTLVLRFIPYVGVWAAAAMPFALSFAAFDDWMHPLAVIGAYGSVESLNYSVLEPWIYAARTGVSPVALLLAAAFWTWLWGLAGLLLSVPITVCLVVMGKYVPQLEFLEVLLGDEPALEPYQQLYQRLLTSNRDEADMLLEEAMRMHSLRELRHCHRAGAAAARGGLRRRHAEAGQAPRGARANPAMGRRAPRGAAARERAQWGNSVAATLGALRPGRGSGRCHRGEAPGRRADQPRHCRPRDRARAPGGGARHGRRSWPRGGGRLRPAAGGHPACAGGNQAGPRAGGESAGPGRSLGPGPRPRSRAAETRERRGEPARDAGGRLRGGDRAAAAHSRREPCVGTAQGGSRLLTLDILTGFKHRRVAQW